MKCWQARCFICYSYRTFQIELSTLKAAHFKCWYFQYLASEIFYFQQLDCKVGGSRIYFNIEADFQTWQIVVSTKSKIECILDFQKKKILCYVAWFVATWRLRFNHASDIVNTTFISTDNLGIRIGFYTELSWGKKKV